MLLRSLAGICDDSIMAAYTDAWDADRMAGRARLEMFIVFLFTKNAYRLRHRTWKQQTIPPA